MDNDTAQTTTPDATHLLKALDRRYKQHLDGRKAEQWVTIPEARSGATFDGNDGQCDYLAINTWQGHGLQLIGHEIKVSPSDWRRELETPEKAERFARYCRRWWVVMPSELAQRSKPEIPPTWGLMSVSDGGRITETVKAPAREPDDVPVWWWVGWLAQIDRRARRSDRSEIDARVHRGIAEATERMDQRVEDLVQRRLTQVENLTETADKLRAATGIDLRHTWDWQIDRLAEVWPLATRGQALNGLADRMREVADMIEALGQ